MEWVLHLPVTLHARIYENADYGLIRVVQKGLTPLNSMRVCSGAGIVNPMIIPTEGHSESALHFLCGPGLVATRRYLEWVVHGNGPLEKSCRFTSSESSEKQKISIKPLFHCAGDRRLGIIICVAVTDARISASTPKPELSIASCHARENIVPPLPAQPALRSLGQLLEILLRLMTRNCFKV